MSIEITSHVPALELNTNLALLRTQLGCPAMAYAPAPEVAAGA